MFRAPGFIQDHLDFRICHLRILLVFRTKGQIWVQFPLGEWILKSYSLSMYLISCRYTNTSWHWEGQKVSITMPLGVQHTHTPTSSNCHLPARIFYWKDRIYTFKDLLCAWPSFSVCSSVDRALLKAVSSCQQCGEQGLQWNSPTGILRPVSSVCGAEGCSQLALNAICLWYAG